MTSAEINQTILRCTEGAVSDFDGLYVEYGGLIRSVLYKLNTGRDIDDLVQEVFIRIWKGLSTFEGGAKLKSWIYRVAYNTAIDNFRKKKRSPSEVELPESLSQPTGPRLDDTELVRKGLNELDEMHRSVLVFHCMEGLSVAETAQVLNIPEGTVKSRLHHAKSKMYSILKAKGATL